MSTMEESTAARTFISVDVNCIESDGDSTRKEDSVADRSSTRSVLNPADDDVEEEAAVAEFDLAGLFFRPYVIGC